MTGLEDKFWDAAITEAATRRGPPDQAHQVLLRLQNPELDGKPARRVPWLRRGLEVAAAAVVLLAIGVLTGLIPLGEKTVDDPQALPRDVAAAPGAEYETIDGVIHLHGGWLLVSTGAPDVRNGDSILSGVDGRVLVHAAGVPSRGQAEAVASWLRANRLELEMIGDIKLWARGTVLAALVLSGSAMLDGQKIEGPKPEVAAAAEWHVVRSVMDIDNLPKDARYVSADGLDAAHLDFLAELTALEGIRFTSAVELRPEHLQGLKPLKNLRWLDLRRAEWSAESDPDYSALGELPALKRVALDTVVNQAHSGGDGPSFVWDFDVVAMPTLRKLAAKGVEIELGECQPESSQELSDLLVALPTLRSIAIYNPTAAEMKLLAAHTALKSLELLYSEAGEIGLAYLARKGTLDELSIVEEMSLDEIHQISRMGLKVLSITGGLADSPQSCFARLASMQGLRRLELNQLGISNEGLFAFKSFRDMQPLDCLRVGPYVAADFELLLAHQVPTRRLEVSLDGPSLYTKEEMPVDLTSGEAGKHLEELRFEFTGAEFPSDHARGDFVAPYKSYPNLKRIELRRGGFVNPTDEDRYVAWMKESLPGVTVVVVP